MSLVYRRALLKLSGEAFPGAKPGGAERSRLSVVAGQIASAHAAGAELAVVMGAGNLIRGKELVQAGLCSRVAADVAGMLATVINGLLLREALEKEGCPARLFSMIPVDGFVERYAAPEVAASLREHHVVLLSGGTGLPYLTTDTAAALMALQIGAQVLLKATKVDGVYEADPVGCAGAMKMERIEALEVLRKRLGIMDLSAVALCGENGLPVVVSSLDQPDAIREALEGRTLGSIILPFGNPKG